MCSGEICLAWLPRLGMSSLLSELTPLSRKGERRRKEEKSQAARCGSGGIPSLPSVLCACESSSPLPSNTPMLLNQGTSKLMFTQLGRNRGREWYFVLSPPSPTLGAWDAGGWGVTDRAGGAELQNRTGLLGAGWGPGLGAWGST